MELNNFLAHIKANKCRITKGKEELFYNAIKKYGYEGPHVQKAMQTAFASPFRSAMQTLIRAIPIDQHIFASSFLTTFLKQRFVRDVDLIELIHSIRFSDKVDQKIVERYGMIQQYEMDQNQLISSIRCFKKEDHKNKPIKWKQIEDTLLESGFADPRKSLSTLLKGETIDSAVKLRQVSQRYRIFVIKDKEVELFDTIHNLGLEDKLSKQHLQKATYLAFHKELSQICSIIVPKNPQANFKYIIDKIVEKLDEYIADEQDIIQLVRLFFYGKLNSLRNIVEKYRLQDEIQEIQRDLCKITSQVKEKSKNQMASKALNYLENKLSAKQQGEIPSNIKSELLRIKDDLQEIWMLDKVNSKSLIASFYSNSEAQFNRITNLYALESEEGVIEDIKSKLNAILSNNPPEDEKLKKKICQFFSEQSAPPDAKQQTKNEQQFPKEKIFQDPFVADISTIERKEQFYEENYPIINNEIGNSSKQKDGNKSSQGAFNQPELSYKPSQSASQQTIYQNPFQSTNNQYNPKTIKLLLIYLSASPIQNIRFEQNSKIEIKSQNYKSMNICYTLAIFDISRQTKYELFLKFENSKNETREILVDQSNNGCKLLILTELGLSRKKMDVDVAINHALFSCVYFLFLKKIIRAPDCQIYIFPWLKLLYDSYKWEITDEKVMLNILSQIQISKDLPNTNSKMLVYFFYSICRESTLKYYEQSNFSSKLTFFSKKKITIISSYPMTEELCKFHSYLSLVDMISSKHGKNFSVQVKEQILFNIRLQKDEDLSKILMLVANRAPQYLVEVDFDVKRILGDRKLFCVHDYYNLRIIYLAILMNQNNITYKQKILLEFMTDLIHYYSSDQHSHCTKAAKITEADIQTLFLESYELRPRVGESALPYLYSRCKILDNVSEHQFNFLTIINLIIQPKIQQLVKSHAKEILLSSLTIPITELDEVIFQTISRRGSLNGHEFKLIIQRVIEEIRQFDIPCFQKLVSELSKNDTNIKFAQIALIQIDNLLLANEKQTSKYQLLMRLFIIFASKIQVVEEYRRQKVIWRENLRNYLQVYCKLKNQMFKHIFINTIYSKLRLKIPKDQQNDIIYEINKQSYIKIDQREHLVNLFLNSNQLSLEFMETQIINLLKSNFNQLHFLNNIDHAAFQKALINITKKINNDDIYKKDLDLFLLNMKDEKYGFKELNYAICQASQRLKDFHDRLRKMILLLGKNKNQFSGEIAYLQHCQGTLQQMRLVEAYKIDEKYKEFYRQSKNTFIIQQYPNWDSSKIRELQDFRTEFKRIQSNLKRSVVQFLAGKIRYNTFKEYFLAINFKEIAEFYFSNDNAKYHIILYHAKLNKREIDQLHECIQSVAYIQSIINSDVNISLSNINQFTQKIDKNQDFLVEDFFKEIKQTENSLLKAFNLIPGQNQSQSSSIFFQKQESVKIIKFTRRYKNMFELIGKKKFNSKNITDLKEYINDLQNSFLNMATVKQFQHVLMYWELIKKEKNFNFFIASLNNFIKKQKVELSKCIENCYACFAQIAQKMDEAVNRQTSFKNEIYAIFQKSCFRINPDLQIQIILSLENTESHIKTVSTNSNNVKELKINYKKLNNYKDKSILLIQDIGHDENIDENLKQLRILFEKYNQFFEVIEGIHQISEKLSNYGYNPRNISCDIYIFNGDYSQINHKKEELMEASNTWLRGIKDLYSKSYLLTHFFGSELNKFIDNCINNVYNPSLERIINMSEDNFRELFLNSVIKEKIERAKSEKPLKRVQLIIDVFNDYEQDFLNSSIIASEGFNEEPHLKETFFISNSRWAKPITLITCSAKQIYSCLVENTHKNQKKIANPTQVLYCQESTSTEEIQFFLDRAMIYRNKTHYIIGAHNLREETKLLFCDQITILLRQRQLQLKNCQLCFVDDVIDDRIYAFISRPKLFQVQKKQYYLNQASQNIKNLVQLLTKTLVISSNKPGLGKTFFVEQESKINGKELKYFPICGNIKFQNLAKRLKKLNLQQKNSLLIQLGHIENKKKLETFLAQIVIFRCFYFQQYIFIPKDIDIYIELQNIIEIQTQDSYHIINLLKNYGKMHVIEKFNVKQIHIDLQNFDDKFVYIYLDLLNKPNWISKNQYSYQDYLKEKNTIKFPQNPVELLQKYFLTWFKERNMEPTYIIFKGFKTMLFNAFKSFAESPYLFITNFQNLSSGLKKLQLQKLRQNFLKICISNALQFLKETVTTNEFDHDKNKLQTVSQMIKNFPLLIAPSFNFSNYQFIYFRDQNVDLSIKSLLLSQDPKYFRKLNYIINLNNVHQLFKETAINYSKGSEQQLRMFKILHELSGNKKFDSSIEVKEANGKVKTIERVEKVYEAIPQLNQYKLTFDNFFKMCLIIHRSNSYIPCVIMGESGVGKTALIDFLVRVVFEETLLIFSVHAGIHEEDLQLWVKQFKEKALKEIQIANQIIQQIQGENENLERLLTLKPKRVWVFFDQFNTTDELNYIKQMIGDRRFLGQTLPSNIVFLAACNPYRKKQESINRVRAGIKKTNQNRGGELAFKVKPPSLSLIQLMWDYQQLGEKENESYIQKMLAEIKYSKKDLLIKCIVETHELFKRTVEVSSVSLRDVARFKELYNWFLIHSPSQNNEVIQQLPQKKANKNSDNLIQSDQRAAVLAFIFCYSLRYSTLSERKVFLQNIEAKMNFEKQHMRKILQNEQRQYINQLKVKNEKIAYNSALMENVFTSLVCLMNKIPVLIIGNPGSSKSLSIKMLNSNLRGENSTALFCKNLPQINMIYYQGSEASTSKGVEQVFEKANNKNLNDQNKKWNILNCILFDEIGLAQISIHNPLKVLHAKLETNVKKIGFIGISNWELDAAKMSRFLVISRAQPDENEVSQTAVKILESYFGQKNPYIDRFQRLGSYYFKFINKWNMNLKNRSGFFGLRDFYCYLKYVCTQIQKRGNELNEIDKAIANSIQINFDGQKNSLKIFKEIASVSEKSNFALLNPIELVNKNLEDPESRCLLLIIRGDSLIPIISHQIVINKVKRKAVCIYGSTFLEDKQSQEYNLKVTSEIINHVSRGSILAFKDINNSIQTSLYDLFNKSFSHIGSKKYCRIAVGANSNPKCHVHQNFNAIVYVDQQKLKDLDLAFLNRFEKHYLNLKSIITNDQIEVLKQIIKWMEDLLSFKNEDMILKNENFLINSSEESIVTLIIKYRKEQSSLVNKIKTDLLKNRTTDFTIAIKNDLVKENMVKTFIQSIDPVNECSEDMIVFTYDQFSNLTEENTIFNRKSHIIRLSEIKNEKSLRKQLKIAFTSNEFDNVEIKVYYQNHYMHINFLLFLAKEVKLSLNSKKQIIIIVQLHRFSLHQLNIDFINISYLHKYQQYFVEDIHSLQEIPLLINSENCWEIYKMFNLSENFGSYCMDALKLIRFECQVEDTKKDYFFQCLEVINNCEYFKINTEKVILSQLIKKKVDYAEIQKNAEDVMCCSNIKEAISNFIAKIIKQLAFYSIKMIISEGFLFFFFENRSLKDYGQDVRNYLAGPYNNQSKRLLSFFETHYEQQSKNLIVKLFNNKLPKINKLIESNIVRIRSQKCLISSTFKDFDLLFEDKENSGRKNLEQISKQISLVNGQQNYENYDIKYQTAKAFIENNFKISSHGFLNIIANSQDLERLYIFDLLKFYLQKNNHSQQNICFYIEILVTFLQKFKVQDKIIILTIDKNIMMKGFQLLSLFLEQVSPKNILEKIIPYNKSDNENALIELLKTLLCIGLQIIHLSNDTIQKFKSKSHYMTYFRLLFIKMREICINYGQYGLQFSLQFLTTNKMLEMFEKINIKNEILIDLYLKEYDKNYTIYFCIYQFCSKLLEDKTIKTGKEIIINFLALDFFCQWRQKLNKTNKYLNEVQICIDSFVKMCNNYTLFANNSVYFISLILSELTNVNSIKQLIDYFVSNESHSYIKESYIDMESNFTIALSNYISSHIEEVLAEQSKNRTVAQEETFITKNYEQEFVNLYDNTQAQHKIFSLFRIEFMKRYVFYYYQLLISNKENQLQNRIDNLLCQENQLMRHLRIYLLKLLLANYKSFQVIRHDYVEKRKCKWILLLIDLLNQNENDIFLPPKMLQKNHKLYQFMSQLVDSNYSDTSIFRKLIIQGLESEKNRSQLLNFFMLNFYTKQIAQNFIYTLKKQLDKIIKLNQQENKLIKQTLQRYMSHRIANQYQFTNNKDFMNQLPLLNYLNIFVASCRVKNPLNDMFFNQDGHVENDYASFLSNRFLIGTMKNPALGRLEFILKKKSQNFAGSSYVNCSNTCDYISPIGGNFYGTYDGCAHPRSQSKCAFCGGVIGALGSNGLTNPEAKIFMPKDLQKMMLPIIRQKKGITLRKFDTNFEYNLLGYQLGNTKTSLKQSMELRKHYLGVATDFLQGQSQMIHHKLLQSIISFIWYYFVEVNLIKKHSLQAIFNQDLENSKIFLNEATNFYFQQANKSVKFGNQNDQIIWHLGIGKLFLNFLINYNEKQQSKQLVNNLTNSVVRDKFEKSFEDFLFPYCQKEKQRLILESRLVKNLNKSDIIREIGDLKKHLLQYPQLKLYKLLKFELSPSYENMKRQYKETLTKDYPILSYLMNNETVEEKLIHFKIIYTFISKLWRIFNHQITRLESKKPLIEALVAMFKENDKERKQIEAQMDQFIKSWNRLAQLKYQLKYECHDFGELLQIDKTYPLNIFLLDKDHMDNIDGRKLISFIIVSANEYNSICGIIENNVKAAYSQQLTKIFSSHQLNPTFLSKDSKVLLFPTEALAEKIEKYSSFSVQYGISNPSYPFDQIQSMIAKEFYGCKYLISEDDKFCYINYIGEQVHFITELREDQNQKTLEQTSMKPRIRQYLKNLQREQTFYKTIKSIQRSLENIVIFFKNFKGQPNMHHKTIKNFVEENRIKGIVKEVLDQPIRSLPLSNLADLYEIIQFSTFEKVKDMLDKVYKKELEKSEKQEFLALVRSMKSENRQLGIPSYADFKVALYRLAGRNLLLMMCNQDKYLAEQLCYVDFYWPKAIYLDYFQSETNLFTQVMGKLTISKVGDMLEYLPFKQDQVIEDKMKNNSFLLKKDRKMESVLGQKPKKKTHKDLSLF